MKVILILPSNKFVLKDKLGISGLPLGLAYLASTLEKEIILFKLSMLPLWAIR